jgi:hypothetical protein
VPRKRTGILVVGVLLAASGLAFLRAEQLKLERSPVTAVHLQRYFSTVCPIRPGTRCRSHSALLRFRLRDAGRVAVTVVAGSGDTVRRLTPATGTRMPKGAVLLRWDGRTDAGATAADGVYHLRVHLRSLGRTISVPDPIDLDDTAPVLRLTSGRGTLPVRYSTSEPAVVYARARALGANASAGALFRGRSGQVHFRPTRLAGAEVALTLVAVDRAGNPSAPVPAGTVRVPR